MFDDILNYSKCHKDCDEDCSCNSDDKCPNCGSDNIGTSMSSCGLGVQMYCIDCGHVWSF